MQHDHWDRWTSVHNWWSKLCHCQQPLFYFNLFFFSKSKIKLGSNPEKQRKFRHRKRILTVFRVFFLADQQKRGNLSVTHKCTIVVFFFFSNIKQINLHHPIVRKREKTVFQCRCTFQKLVFFSRFYSIPDPAVTLSWQSICKHIKLCSKIKLFHLHHPFFLVEHTVRKTNVFSTKSSVSTTNFSNIWNFWCSCQHFFSWRNWVILNNLAVFCQKNAHLGRC